MLEPNYEFISVQPENRTRLEEALEYAWHKLIERAGSPYPDLRSPLTTQDDFVSLLAGERGVQDWQPSDTPIQRRETTARAFEIHSKAGSREGLKMAIEALGFSADIERSPLPYSLFFSAELEAESLSKEIQSRLHSRANAYKSERDTIDLRLVRGADVHLCVGGLVETGVILDCQPFVQGETDSETAVFYGVLSEIYITIDCESS